MNENRKGAPKSFPKIRTEDELRTYLDDSHRLNNTSYLYHYTTVPVVIRILRGRLWHLGNAFNMNDMLEYTNGDPAYWHNLFFSCFMGEDKESIGMWSMYAQPWEKGVKIAIHKDKLRKWLKGTQDIWEISPDTYQPTGRKVHIGENGASLRLSSVAYSNTDSLQKKDDREVIKWGGVSNTNIKNAVRIPALTGYVKDMAWSYEKEVRIKAEFNNEKNFQRVAISLTDELVKSMIITASPLFDGDLWDELQKETYDQIETEQSVFTHKLNIRTICQDCKFKRT